MDAENIASYADSQSFSSADFHRLNKPSLLHPEIWSDLYSFASFIISYSPMSGCFYFIVLHYTYLHIINSFSNYLHSSEYIHILKEH